MATTGIHNGHNVRIFATGTAIAKATDCQISVSRATRETSHKDIGAGAGAGWKGNEYGEGSWEMSGSALLAEGESFETLWAALDAKTKLAVQFSSDVAGDQRFTGTGLITQLDTSAPNNEDVSFSYTIVGDGALTREVVV